MRKQIEDFLHYQAVEKGHSDNTLVAYHNDLGQFMEALEARVPPPSSWSEVNRDVITSYLTQLRERGYASSTIARKVAALKSFFHFLVHEGLASDNPTTALHKFFRCCFPYPYT